MLVDFNSETLPVARGHYQDTSRSKRVARSNWSRILNSATDVLLDCLREPRPIGGWTKVDDEIAVLLLPMRSDMRLHWANEMEAQVVNRTEVRWLGEGGEDV